MSILTGPEMNGGSFFLGHAIRILFLSHLSATSAAAQSLSVDTELIVDSSASLSFSFPVALASATTSH